MGQNCHFLTGHILWARWVVGIIYGLLSLYIMLFGLLFLFTLLLSSLFFPSAVSIPILFWFWIGIRSLRVIRRFVIVRAFSATGCTYAAKVLGLLGEFIRLSQCFLYLGKDICSGSSCLWYCYQSWWQGEYRHCCLGWHTISPIYLSWFTMLL